MDKNGTELQGTRVRGMPVCPSQGRSSMYMLMQVYGAAHSKGFFSGRQDELSSRQQRLKACIA